MLLDKKWSLSRSGLWHCVDDFKIYSKNNLELFTRMYSFGNRERQIDLIKASKMNCQTHQPAPEVAIFHPWK